MRDLLVTVAHHASPERLPYLQTVLRTFAKEYDCSHDIIIDTNVASLIDVYGGVDYDVRNTTICSHVSLAHPFFLTWQHRRHMADRIDDFGYFLYIENDMVLPYENFLAYQRHFEQLWPAGYVPGFVRVERHEGEEYAVDQTVRQGWNERVPHFCELNPGYHGFWLMPRKELKETMSPNFVRLSDSREAAASYPTADLGRTPLVQVDGRHVVRTSLAYHVSNKFAPCPDSANGKIKVSEIFA